MDDLENFQINIDLENVDDGTDPVPAGQPPCNIHTVTAKHKAGSEYPYFEVVLKPVDMPNKTGWLNLSLHPKALWNMKLFLKACGVRIPSGNLDFRTIKELMESTRGMRIAPTFKVVPANNDPDRKVNEIGPPYAAVR